MAHAAPQEISLTTKNTASLTMGIAAIVVGIFALLFGWVPFLGLFAIPVAMLGIVLAGIGLLLAVMRKFKGAGLPLLGGVLSIAGGKLTAYRRMVERVADRVVEELGKSAGKKASEDQPLVGGDLAPVEVDEDLKAGRRPQDRLADLYGSEAADVLADGADVAAEVRQAVHREGALRLEDYWMRRSARAFFDLDAGLSTLEPASREMARLLEWSEETRLAEVAYCRHRNEENNALFEEARSKDAQ